MVSRRLVLPVALAPAFAFAAQPAPAEHPVVPLWPGVAPGSEGKTGDESVRTQGDDQIVSGVHRPSLTVYLPPATSASGAAVIVAPGGSYRELWITHEGYRVAEWLSRHGVAAFVLKYRLPREAGSSYTEATALGDMQRAIRTVRARAREWNVDPERIGAIGFSAGAHLVGVTAAHHADQVAAPADETDRQSARPAFQALIYPPRIPAAYTKETPQAFLLCGGDDNVSANISGQYQALKDAGVPTELIVFAGVGHGFGVRAGNPPRVAGWIDRFYDWLRERGFLTRKGG